MVTIFFMNRLLAVLLTVSFFLNVFLIFKRAEPSDTQQGFTYLSKRILTENQNDILISFIPLRAAMKEYVGKQSDEIGVYFEYLPSGTSIGVNNDIEVRLASLIKIPVVMAIYKQIERGNLKKDQTLTIREEDIDKLFGNLWKKGSGAKISVEEAVRISLVESDNTATKTLASALPERALDDIFDNLDIPKDTQGTLFVISPKNYSSILRSLYLSSYLTKDHSNEILEILTQTNFKDKLPAGVPQDIKVAHKTGVFESEQAYSDCGIFYPANRPYLLCIMAKSNESKAREYMQHISKMVYEHIVVLQAKN